MRHRLKKEIKAFFEKEWTLNEKIFVVMLVSLAGMIAGMILAPSRKVYYHEAEGRCDKETRKTDCCNSR